MRTNLGFDERVTGTAPPSQKRSVTGPKPQTRPLKSSKRHEQKLGATARSFAILEHVAGSRAPVDVLDIVASLKLPKATAYRLVDWFITQGYLSREPGRRRLIIGPKLTHLAFGALSSSMRHDISHVVLQRLVHTLNETCNIGTLLNGEVVYLDRVEVWIYGASRIAPSRSAPGLRPNCGRFARNRFLSTARNISSGSFAWQCP